jgi:hypothetical protein
MIGSPASLGCNVSVTRRADTKKATRARGATADSGSATADRRLAGAHAPPSGHRCNMHRIDTVYAQRCLTAVVAFRA